MVFGFGKKTTMPARDEALPGRDQRPFQVNPTHVVLGTPLEGPWPDGSEVLYVAMGCFWGVERIFWRLPGVVNTSVGYMGGYTPNPTYEETCTGLTGHAETVRVVYDPSTTSPELLLKEFWENHDLPVGDLLDDAGPAGGRGDDSGRLPEGAARERLRRDHHGDPVRRGRGAFLPRRGLPPGLPAQEPRRLLQPRSQRNDLPHRHRPPGPAPVTAGDRATGVRSALGSAGAGAGPCMIT